MDDSITLYVSEDSDECPCIFTLPESVVALAGNLLEYNGEFFPVKDTITILPCSPEYRLITSLCTIRRATAVFFCFWRSENG